MLILITCVQLSKSYNSNDFKLDVPQIYQLDDYSCATTSAAMVISYFSNKTLDKDKVWDISGLNISNIKNYGNDMNGLKKVADFYGYESIFKESMSISDLEHLIYSGIPVIINILQKKNLQLTHAVVLVGYDKKRGVFFVNDPAEFIIGKEINYNKLNDLWTASVKGINATNYNISYKSGFIIYPKK